MGGAGDPGRAGAASVRDVAVPEEAGSAPGVTGPAIRAFAFRGNSRLRAVPPAGDLL